VHTRVLYAMYDGGYRPDRGFFKCARVVGEVMGIYHPHGDSAIYDALVGWPSRGRCGCRWSTARATSAPGATTRPRRCAAPSLRLAPLAMEMLRDIDKDTVDFRRTTTGAPAGVVLPARFPNLLVNGSGGSRSGWPPRSRRTTCARSPRARSDLLDHFDATDDEAARRADQRIKGPDFPPTA
jgi:DNA gyrase subunit A